MIRVVVVDDEALIRSGFELILAQDPGIEAVATAADFEALETIDQYRPDVVLLDIRMPHVDGLTILRELMGRDNSPVVVMLTTFDVDEYVLEALRLGASGFLLKDTDPRQLATMVRTVIAGGVVLSPTVTRSVISGCAESGAVAAASAAVARLTDRERTILVQVALGRANREIGELINVSVGTVKDDMSAILGKLEVGTRVEAALIAQQAGIVTGSGA
ncbi:response regulator transcription factor [Nocardia uniformis]|uniref:Response regulator transcription factor n=1 Tax=Nocardia uniformis TaxID=53432 RepID=A0A849C583_9NOCA|nr:response regulator transcription factor [Nocardia uniformis]NNH71580.1 response regulator transcription factor [Nocardia uniformis]